MPSIGALKTAERPTGTFAVLVLVGVLVEVDVGAAAVVVDCAPVVEGAGAAGAEVGDFAAAGADVDVGAAVTGATLFGMTATWGRADWSEVAGAVLNERVVDVSFSTRTGDATSAAGSESVPTLASAVGIEFAVPSGPGFPATRAKVSLGASGATRVRGAASSVVGSIIVLAADKTSTPLAPGLNARASIATTIVAISMFRVVLREGKCFLEILAINAATNRRS